GHRLAVGLADDVPQRRLQRPVPAGVVGDRLQRADVAGDGPGVLADEQVPERREPVHRVARADADDALVGLDTDEGGGERAARDRVPGGGERRVEGQLEPGDADVGDLHVTWVGSKWALDGASAAARTSSSAGRASAPAASAARVASRLWRYTAPARSGVAPGSTQTAAMSRRSSTSWAGTTPSRTASATPAATPAWAGPHVREACTSPST